MNDRGKYRVHDAPVNDMDVMKRYARTGMPTENTGYPVNGLQCPELMNRDCSKLRKSSTFSHYNRRPQGVWAPVVFSIVGILYM